MRHRYRHFGAVSSGQLALFDPITRLDWTDGTADSDRGTQRDSSEQRFGGRQRLHATVALLARAEQSLVSGPVPLHAAHQLVIDALAVGLAGNEDTVEDTISCANKLFKYLRDHRVEHLDDVSTELVEQFIDLAAHRAGRYWDPSPATRRDRRWKVKEIFTSLTRLGLWDGPVLFGERIPSRCGDRHRPLTDRELHAVRSCSYHWLLPVRRPIVVALAEAGGSAAEIAAVEASDLDLSAGTVRFRVGTPRVNPIPEDALQALGRALADGAAQGHRIAVTDPLDANKAKRSVTQELSEVMRDAGLSRVPRVSGRSIRLHHALELFDRGGIGAASRFLGNQSLDITMRSLRLTVEDV